MSLSEADLLVRLRARMAPPEYAFFSHVRNATGFSRRVRTADAIAFGLFPSRGLHLHGFEIKSCRGDWLREKRDPEKADEIARYCDFWWVVVGDESVAKVDEVPTTWGLLVPHGQGLRAVKSPTKNETPTQITRQFLGAILRRASEESAAKGEIDEAVQVARRTWEETVSARIDAEVKRRQGALSVLEQTVQKFEAASGVSLTTYEATWQAEAMGRAVKVITSAYVGDVIEATERQARDLAWMLEQTQERAKELRKALAVREGTE